MGAGSRSGDRLPGIELVTGLVTVSLLDVRILRCLFFCSAPVRWVWFTTGGGRVQGQSLVPKVAPRRKTPNANSDKSRAGLQTPEKPHAANSKWRNHTNSDESRAGEHEDGDCSTEGKEGLEEFS